MPENSKQPCGHHWDLMSQRLEVIERDMKLVRESLEGNGKQGIKTRLALLESHQSGASKFGWMIAGGMVSAGATVAALLFVGGVS